MSAPKRSHMRVSQPGARILVDHGLQRSTVGKDAEAKGLLTGKHRGRCNPILRLALAGGRLSAEIRDLPAAAVEAIGRTVGRKQDEVHEAVPPVVKLEARYAAYGWAHLVFERRGERSCLGTSWQSTGELVGQRAESSEN